MGAASAGYIVVCATPTQSTRNGAFDTCSLRAQEGEVNSTQRIAAHRRSSPLKVALQNAMIKYALGARYSMV